MSDQKGETTQSLGADEGVASSGKKWAMLIWVYLLLIPLVTVPLTYNLAMEICPAVWGSQGSGEFGCWGYLRAEWGLPGLLNLLPGLLLFHRSTLVRSHAFWGFINGFVRLGVLPLAAALAPPPQDGLLVPAGDWDGAFVLSIVLWVLTSVGPLLVAAEVGSFRLVADRSRIAGGVLFILACVGVAMVWPGDLLHYLGVTTNIANVEARRNAVLRGWLEAVQQGDMDKARGYWATPAYWEEEGKCWSEFLYAVNQKGGWEIETPPTRRYYENNLALQYLGTEPLTFKVSKDGRTDTCGTRRSLFNVAVNFALPRYPADRDGIVKVRLDERWPGNCRNVSGEWLYFAQSVHCTEISLP